MQFNLIDEPWLVVRNVSGALETISMRSAFRRAHEIRGLAGELPTQDFAVLRILLAVIYRAVFDDERDNPAQDWAQLWQCPTLPTEVLDDYLDQWHSRFDLFDDKLPWFQVADLATAKGDSRPVDLLLPDSAASDSLFSMRRGYSSITPAEAARWLIHCQAFDVSGIKTGALGDPRVKGGKGFPIGIGWSGWLGGITVMGDTLRETLLLNLVLGHEASDADLPVWELPALTSAPRPVAVADGPVSLATWPQRRIRLFTDGERVNAVLVCNGDPVDYVHQHKNELMTGWRHSKPQSAKFHETIYMPRAFDPSVAVWRGLPALLPVAGTEDGSPTAFQPAGVLRWVSWLSNAGFLPNDYLARIRTVGVMYGPQSASWDEIFSDELTFDIRLAAQHSTPAKQAAFAACNRANEAVNALGSLARNLQIAAGGDDTDASGPARSAGFSALDPLFRQWLAELDLDADLEQQLSNWTEEVRRVIIRLGEKLARDAGPVAWAGRTVIQNQKETTFNTGLAEAWFRGSLAKALPFTPSEGAES